MSLILLKTWAFSFPLYVWRLSSSTCAVHPFTCTVHHVWTIPSFFQPSWAYVAPFTLPKSPYKASLVAQLVKNPPVMEETWVQSPGGEDLLEKGMATHSSILAWRIPRTEAPDGLWSLSRKRVGHDLATKLQQQKSPYKVSLHIIILKENLVVTFW